MIWHLDPPIFLKVSLAILLLFFLNINLKKILNTNSAFVIDLVGLQYQGSECSMDTCIDVPQV